MTPRLGGFVLKSLASCVTSLLLCAATSALGEAQKTNPQLSPTQTVDLFIKAQNAERWGDAADFLDREAIEKIRRRELENTESRTRFPWTVEKLMKEDTAMPRVVAEYEIRRMDRLAKDFDVEKTWSYEFAEIGTLEDLRKLPGQELAARWVMAHDLGYRSRRAKATCPQVETETLKKAARPALPKRTYRMLGEVVKDSMAYVLKEDGFDGKPSYPLADVGIFMPPEIFILRKVAGTWKIVPSVRTTASIVSIECVVEPTSPREKQ